MLLGPLAILALLLVAAGASKMRAPGATATALSALGLPAGSQVVARLLGLVEIAVGGSALLIGDRRTALAVAVAHVAFAAVTAALLRRPQVPCGCFGAPDAPATVTGLVCNLASAAVAAVAVVRPPGALGDWVSARPVEGLSLVAVVLVGAWLLHQIHSALPTLVVER